MPQEILWIKQLLEVCTKSAVRRFAIEKHTFYKEVSARVSHHMPQKARPTTANVSPSSRLIRNPYSFIETLSKPLARPITRMRTPDSGGLKPLLDGYAERVRHP